MGKITKKIASFILALFVTVGLLGEATVIFANASSDEVSGTIEVAMHKNNDLMQPYIDAFQRKYPKVKVKYTFYENYEGSMAERLSAGDFPDVFYLPGAISYNDYPNYLLKLGDMQELSGKYKYMEKSVYQNDEVYGLPSYAFLYGFIYNKKVFAEAGITSIPTTIPDFLQACELIKLHTDAIPFYMNYNDYWAMSYWETYPFIEMNGSNNYRYTEYLNTENPFGEGSSHYEVYKLMYDLIDKGYTEDPKESGYADGGHMLAAGNVAVMSMGSWAFGEISGLTSDNELGFMPFPNNIDGKQYMTVGTDYCIGIAKSTKYPEASRAFVDFMIDESGYAYNAGNISIMKGDAYPEYLADLQDKTMLYDYYAGIIDYQLISALNTYVTPGSQEEMNRIIDAALGRTSETFSDIMEDWNTRWEKGRPDGYQAIVNENFESNEIVTSNAKMTISTTEKKYIQDNPNLTVGYIEEFAPFSFTNEAGELVGLVIELCDLFEENTGINLEMIPFANEKEVFSALVNSNIDFAVGISTPGYEGITYSKSFFEMPAVYLTREGTDLNDYINLNKSDSLSTIGQIKDIEEKNADYALINYYSANYYRQYFDYSDLELQPNINSVSLYVAFPIETKNTLVALVNKSIYALSDNERMVQLYKYVTPEKRVTMKRLMRSNPTLFIIILIVVFGSILLAILAIIVHMAHANAVKAFEMKKYQMLSELADEYFFDIDCKKMRVNFDKSFTEIFGFPEGVEIANYTNEKKPVVDFLEVVNTAIMNKNDDKSVVVLTKEETGIDISFRLMLSYMKDKDNDKILYVVGKLINVQDEVNEMQNAQQQASTDPLTKLYNRRGFTDTLPAVAQRALYLVCDCDNFKNVNDTLGHEGGDVVLIMVADALKNTMGENAIVGRFGGDEFVAMIPEIDGAEAEARVRNLVETMDREVTYQSMKHRVSVSVGAVYFTGKVNVEDMFKYADDVLYEKKKNGKNGYLIRKM